MATLAMFPERLGNKYTTVECNEYFLDEMQDEVGCVIVLVSNRDEEE